MRIAYARVSTTEQKLDRQLDNLNAAGYDRIFTEKMTGTTPSRPVLQEMIRNLRQGDIVIVDSFSRLSRSTKDLLNMIDTLQQKDVQLISLKENLDTNSATGKMMLTMLSALSQFERDLIAERTTEGLKAAKARGRLGGRPKANSEKVRQAMKLIVKGVSIADAAKASGISTSTISRRIADSKEKTR
jgi:DNA invertase Pin-like site-specific DNA recombinase